jgi:hypothetical protein
MFISGQPISVEGVGPCFAVAAPRVRLVNYDVLPNARHVPLVSPRVAHILAEICPNDIQLVPAHIRTRDVPIDDYFLLHVAAKISGIDHSRSTYSMIPGTQSIMSFERLRYAPGAMGSHHLARESEYLPFLWVSDNIVQKFTRENIKACEFAAPESIHP